MAKINVVMIGVGHDHAHDNFIYISKESNSFNLLGICFVEDDEANYKKWKNDYDQCRHFSLDDVLSLNNLDAVIIDCDDRYLSKYAKIFALANIPIQIDKPGSQDKKLFDEVLDIARKNNGIIHFGYMYRYNPSIKDAIQKAKDGVLGKIYYIEAQMNITHPLEKRKWLKNFDGGMMNFLGCHLVDVIVSILGKPDSVTSFNTSSSDEAGNDISLAVLKYGNTMSTINTTAVEIHGFERRHIVIVGEKGVIEISPTELFKDGSFYSISKYKTDGTNSNLKDQTIEFGPYHRYKEMFEEFASIVRGEIKNPYTLEHEKLVHDVLLACSKPYGKVTKL